MLDRHMKLLFTDNSDIRLGFEIECVVTKAFSTSRNQWSLGTNVAPRPTSKLREFQAEIRALSKTVKIGEDGSITCSDYDKPVEIRTAPLPPKSAIILLEKLLNIVNKYGHTNQSCGFHVNISSAHKSKMKKFNPIPFLYSPLWDEILNKFNRRSNTFCRPLLNKIRITNFYTMHNLLEKSRSEKYRCVNLRHFGTGIAKTSRIEVRGIGNVDYSKKFDIISAYIKRIEKLFKLSCGAFSKVKTPKV